MREPRHDLTPHHMWAHIWTLSQASRGIFTYLPSPGDGKPKTVTLIPGDGIGEAILHPAQPCITLRSSRQVSTVAVPSLCSPCRP